MIGGRSACKQIRAYLPGCGPLAHGWQIAARRFQAGPICSFWIFLPVPDCIRMIGAAGKTLTPKSAPTLSGEDSRVTTRMTHRDRVLGALTRSGYDRIPVKHEGTPEVNQMLMSHFGLSNRSSCCGFWATIFAMWSRNIVGRPCERFRMAAWRAILANATSTHSSRPDAISKPATCLTPA